MAEGCFPWWKVETRIAKAWTWFMLTLNWSCNIRARSSHMLASVSSLLRMIPLFKYQNNQIDVVTPNKKKISRSIFLHFPAPLGVWACCCHFCCCCCCCCWATSCCWPTLFFWFLHNCKCKPDILQLTIATTRSNQLTFIIVQKLSQCSFTQSTSAPDCNTFWVKNTKTLIL